MPPVAPLFTNDLVGLIKVLAIIAFTVLLPVAALVVYFLKRGPDDAIRGLRADLNGLGGKITLLEASDVRISDEVNHMRETIGEAQRELMAAIRSSHDAQITAVHAVELQVARVQERTDIGESLSRFGAAVERLVEVIAKRAD